ncbi:MAG: glycosyltransferase family 2 protein [Desulfotomaculaceae bacterium]
MYDAQKLKISVALCTYNGGRFIEAQMNSILKQSRPPDEVIVCDDGSTDNTVDIVRSIAVKHPGKVWVYKNQINLGCVKNFGQAIQLATGDIIFLSDQDDVWFYDKIKSMSAPFIEDHRIGLVYSDAVITDKSLKPTGETLFGRRKNLGISSVRSACQLIKGVGINGCTMAFRSSLKDIILPIYKGWGHDHWIVFIAHAVTGIRPVGKSLIFYRRHGNNCGIDPTLEDEWLTRWKNVLQSSGTPVYTGDRQRWEAMCRRLGEIADQLDTEMVNQIRLREFLVECRRRLEFALHRERLKKARRIKRWGPLLWSLFKGDYHRHLRGVKSFLKDVLIK